MTTINNNTPLSRRTILKALAGIPLLGFFSYETVKGLNYIKEKENRVIKELGLESLKKNTSKPPSSPNKGDRLNIGIIGYGTRGIQLVSGLGFKPASALKGSKDHLENWMEQDDLNVALIGICEVFELRAEEGIDVAKNGICVNGKVGADYPAKRYRNYKEMLDDKDIDAVIIATPEHLHAQMTIDAAKAGKHIYCEKSFTRTEQELYDACDAVRNSNVVFQLGHQVSQNIIFQQAREIINKNILGKITLIEATSNRNTASGAWVRHIDKDGHPKPGDERLIDWKQWLGSSPHVPFSIDRYYNWTKWFHYSTGMLGQLFTHEFDAINQLLRIGIPKSAVTSGGIYFWQDGREIPDTLNSVFEYPDKELSLLYSASLASSRGRGRVIMGHDGSMEIGNTLKVTADYASTRYKDQIENGIIETSGPMITVSPGSGKIDAISSATEKYYTSRGLTSTYINGKSIDITHLHLKEWIDCIRNGGTPSANIEMAFEEGVTVMMAHKSYVEKRRVEWDPIKRTII